MSRIAIVLLAISLTSPSLAQSMPPNTETGAKSGAPKNTVKAGAKKQSSPQATAIPSAASGPCIGVIPLIGDRFSVKKIGITVFGNEDKQITVHNWGLDDLAVERVRAIAGPGVTVRRVTHAVGAFDSYHPGLSLNPNNDGNLAASFQRAGIQLRCERYVIVTRAQSQYIGNQSIAGIGIVNSGRPIRSHTNVHAVIRIHVHDGSSFVVLKSGFGSTNGNNFLTRVNVRTVDDSLFPEQPEGADAPAIRGATRALLTEMLDKSLPELLAP